MVPVDDILIHPRDNDLILGTHGRSIYILDDITPLEQISRAGFDSPLVLFDVREATVFNPASLKGSLGDKVFVAANPPYGASLAYYLKEDAAEDAQLVISDSEGSVVRRLNGPKKTGLHRMTWDLRHEPPAAGETTSSVPAFGLRQGPSVIPGDYTVALKVGGLEAAGKLRVVGDPRISVSVEDRKAQRDALLEAAALTSTIAKVESAAASLKRKLESAQSLLKTHADPPQALTEALAGAVREVDAVRAEIAGRPGSGFSPESMRSSLRGRLVMAARTVGAATEAPSSRSLAEIASAGKKLRELTDRLNAVIERGLPRLNALMAEAGIPHLQEEQPVRW